MLRRAVSHQSQSHNRPNSSPADRDECRPHGDCGIRAELQPIADDCCRLVLQRSKQARHHYFGKPFRSKLERLRRREVDADILANRSSVEQHSLRQPKLLPRAFFLLLVGATFAGLSHAGQAQSTITIGETAVLSAGDGGNGNLLLAQMAKLSQTATIQSLSFYVTNPKGNLRLGIYDATGPSGGPGALKAQTNAFATVKGWNTSPVVTPVSLVPGNYWLAYLPSSNNLGFVKQNNSGNCWYYTHTFGVLPSKFSTAPTSCTPTTWSLYATLTTSVTAVNGACGSANGVPVSSPPSSGLCVSGTASSVTGSGPWNWTCAGSNGGTTASCSAPLASNAVNGQCGSANGTYTNAAPTTNLCAVGTASAVSGSGPWTWSCSGSNGGTNASCEAYTPAAPQKPGPSAQLFDNPYYTCVRDYYVSPSGSDSNDGLSPTLSGGHGPWLTIARADTSSRSGGDCINIEPGTYAQFNENITYGGDAATSTGYVVYRCTTPEFISGTGCVIPDTGKAVCAGENCSNAYPNYLIFDGFNFVTTDQTVQNDVAITCTGPGTYGENQTQSFGCHHWWIINNVITGHGQSGVNINDTEYLYTVHNTVTQNAHMGCVGYYGSGIAYVVPKPVSSYAKTADDTNADNNPALNMMGLQGPSFPFNNVVAWNVVGNNYQGCNALGNTDGNGIIMDTFNISACNANMINYPNSSLVAFNVSYNNGGGGVHVFSSSNVTVANNSTFYNYTDPTQQAWDRPNIDVNCGAASNGFGAGTNQFLNNIAYAIPKNQACPGPNNTYPGSQIPFTIGGDGTHLDAIYNSPGRNLSYSIGSPCNESDASGNATQTPPDPAWSCTTNVCNTNPLWVNVGNTSIGSESAPPNGLNFALQPGSPAIGLGATEPYLPSSSVDSGACSSEFTTCP
jgi:hypothetical protein